MIADAIKRQQILIVAEHTYFIMISYEKVGGGSSSAKE
jgi:hypothetical protein